MSGISPHHFGIPKKECKEYVEDMNGYLNIPEGLVHGVIYSNIINEYVSQGNILQGKLQVLTKGLNNNSPELNEYHNLYKEIEEIVIQLDNLRDVF